MLSEEQVSLVIMDMFKGQDNLVLEDLCKEYNCEMVIESQIHFNHWISNQQFFFSKKDNVW